MTITVLLITICMTIASTYFFSKSYTNFLSGNIYREFPTLEKIDEYYLQNKAYLKGKNKKDFHRKNQIQFEKFLISKFISVTSYNSRVNDRKLCYISQSKKILILVLIGFLLLFLFAVVSISYDLNTLKI